jgi:biopolymer transport protein ExbB/TolQ
VENTASSGNAHDFTLVGLILNADIVVQAVMLGLALASVACWAIIFEKAIRLSRLSREVRQLEEAARSGLTQVSNCGLAQTLLFAAAEERVHGASAGEGRNDVRARLEKAMRSASRQQLQRAQTGLPFLATVGSGAPFIGLFGTVWGIMNSFTSIAQARDTSLAIVAPGIAEALFATALGLAAAIPAVIAYNQISVSLGKASARIGAAIGKAAQQISAQPQPRHNEWAQS